MRRTKAAKAADELDKAEAIAMAHKVFGWMRDANGGREPDRLSTDPVEREYAEWLDNMRKAKAAYDRQQRKP